MSLPARDKRQAVFAVLKDKRKVTSVARELQVSRKAIYSWIKRYKVTPSRTKKEAFESKYVRGKVHPRAYRYQLKDKLLKEVVRNPSASVTSLAKKLNTGRHALYSLLSEFGLTTKEDREAFKRLYSAPGRLTHDIKVSIARAAKEGTPVSHLAREHNISRKTIYKWLNRYNRDGQVVEKYISGYNHHRAFSKDHVNAILQGVVKAPELSIHNLAKTLGVSSHGLHNVLKRYNLTHNDARLAYSRARNEEAITKPVPTGFLDRIRLVWEQFVPSLAPAPPPKGVPPFRRAAPLFKFFFVSSFLTFIISFGSLSWFAILDSAQTFSQTVGLVFATLALFMGSLFFIYSLKYYITLAIVLSFSQQESGIRNQELGGKKRKRRGFISWLLGLSDESSSDKQSGKAKAIGLEPSLERVVLKRQPYVSVHIPFYNEKYVVERSIKAATNFDYQGDYEVILCDDSNDETTQIIQDYILKSSKQYVVGSKGKDKSHATYYKLHTTKGDGWTLTQVEVKPGVTVKHLHRTSRSGYKGGALKKALELTDPKAEFVSVFDADFVPYPDTLELFLKYFQATAGTLDFQRKSQISNYSNSPNYSKKTPNPNDQNPNLDIGHSDIRNSLGQLEIRSIRNSNIAAVQGYQWHVLNKSENWITRGVRSEYSGSYVIERSGEEIYSGLKQISGAVYMIRRDVLEEVGWETSITEDFQLTLKLYEKGYKVVYTPYIQAPAECVSTLKRLVRQRMRWAEGHSNNIRRMFLRLMVGRWENIPSSGSNVGKFLSSNYSNYSKQVPNPKSQLGQLEIRSIRNSRDGRRNFIPSPLTLSEKLEFLYLSPYYLQAFFFLVGTFAWLISETLFPARLPFWTTLWGWSLVLTNLLALPLMNSVGLFLEESEERDYMGIVSFFALTYILVPFQAYASLKGFLQREEGPWFRTPKTGRITDVIARGRFYRFISGILPGRSQAAPANLMVNGQLLMTKKNINNQSSVISNYLSLATANNRFNSFGIRPKRRRWVGKVGLVVILAISITLVSFSPYIGDSIAEAGARLPEIISGKQDYKLNEKPQFILDLKKTNSKSSFRPFVKDVRAIEDGVVETEVLFKGEKTDILVEVKQRRDGRLDLSVETPKDFKPGRYELRAVVERGSQKMLATQEFTWGVLAINTDKSVYKSGDIVSIAFAVLDNKGNMVCDASLKLNIQNAKIKIEDELSTESGDISVNPECRKKDLVTRPDYEAEYKVDAEGVYKMELTALTQEGKRVITDSFEVRNNVEFDIQRVTSTRIYPIINQPVKIVVIPREDYLGEVVEVVPDVFEILGGSEFVVNDIEGEDKELIWEVEWEAGSTYELYYEYNSPNTSPEFYTLGPLRIGSFEESRFWNIAVDVNTPGNYMIRRNNADTTAVTTSNLDALWDTEVETKGSSITYSAGTFTLASGKYLVIYSERFHSNDTGNNNRNEIQGRLVIGGTATDVAAGQTYMRKEDGSGTDWQRDGIVRGSGIINIASDSTSLVTRFYRTDDDTDPDPTNRFVDWGGVVILALDDSWNYARYSRNTSLSPNPDAFADLVWQDNDEQDTGFSRTNGEITITNAGRYLVTYSIPIQKVAGSGGAARTELVTRMTLNNTEIEGTQVSTYIRGNQSTNDGVISYSGIINVAASDVLAVEMDMTDGTASNNTIDADANIQILELPAGNETVIVGATSGEMNPATLTEFAWDTTDYINAAAFTHTNPTDSFIEVDVDDDYLFFATHKTDNGGTRTYPSGRFSVNDTISQHMSGGQYNRSSGADQAGYSVGTLLTGLNATDNISFENIFIEVGQISQTVASGAMSGLRLGSIFDQDLDQQRYRWRNDDGSESTATFSQAEDTTYTNFPRETVTRLRFLVSNDGIDTAANTYQLQVNQTATCTDAGYTAVPTDSSGHWQIVGSANITDGEATTNVSVGGGLTDPTGGTFTAGEAKDTGNTTGSITVEGSGGGQFTEIEFVLQATANSLDNTNYCFRLNNVDIYTQYAEAIVVPEYLWLFFGFGPLLPGFIGRMRKRKDKNVSS